VSVLVKHGTLTRDNKALRGDFFQCGFAPSRALLGSMFSSTWEDSSHCNTLSPCRYIFRSASLDLCIGYAACTWVKSVGVLGSIFDEDRNKEVFSFASGIQDPEMLVRRYEREIKELKQELAMHDAINGRGHTVYEPYTPVQRSELRVGVKEFLEVRGHTHTHTHPHAQTARRFLFLNRLLCGDGVQRDDPQGQSGIEPLDMPSLRHVREILLQCRELYQAVPVARAGPCKACGACSSALSALSPSSSLNRASLCNGTRLARWCRPRRGRSARVSESFPPHPRVLEGHCLRTSDQRPGFRASVGKSLAVRRVAKSQPRWA